MAKAKIIENKNENLIQKINSFFLKYFNVFVFLIVLIIVIVGFYTAILPKYRNIMQVTKAKNLSNENEYNSRMEYMDMINKLQSNYEKIEKDKIGRIEAFLPDDSSESELYAKIESLAAENGVSLNSLTVGGSGADDKSDDQKKAVQVKNTLAPEINMVNVSLGLSGLNYNSFKNFLYVIENNLELMDIKNITFSPADGTLQLEISTYFYKTS